MTLKKYARFIGVFMIILGAVAVIGSFLTISKGTISFLLAGINVEYIPLFGELKCTLWDFYPPDILLNYLLYDFILNELFSNIFTNIALSSTHSVFSILILILGVAVVLIGILEVTDRISVIIVVLTLIFGVALILLPIIEYYTFKNEILETVKLFYLIGGFFIDWLFPWDLFSSIPIIILFMEISAEVTLGFYIILISGSIITIISLLSLIKKD